MSQEHGHEPPDPRVWEAVQELQATIRAKYPTTRFDVHSGVDDPEETWVVATVDLDDPDAVLDLVIDRLLDLQIEQGVPVHVLLVHTPERIRETQRRAQTRHPQPAVPLRPGSSLPA
ncbi:MAG: hypothetical protein ACR2PL_18570 [Dehalococcoidia bacterium]